MGRSYAATDARFHTCLLILGAAREAVKLKPGLNLGLLPGYNPDKTPFTATMGAWRANRENRDDRPTTKTPNQSK